MAESKPNKEVRKAETIGNRDIVRPPTARERGQPRIVTSSRFVQDARDRDLAMPQRLCVFDTMYQTEEAIYNSVDVTNVPTLYALTNGKAVAGPSNSSASRAAADFINYNIRNMSSGTWAEAMNNMLTDIIYGWSFLNIVTERRNHGQYAGMRCLKKLAPRSQHSLYGWVWDKDFREPLGFVQRPNRIQNRNPRIADFEANISINQLINSTSFLQNYPYLRKEQLLHSRYNPINTNPQGDSPLLHCYESYTEKRLIEKYELIGVSKDLGGSVVLRVPSDLIQKANDPANYPDEAAEYRQLQEDASALQAGEQTFILLSSDVDPETKIRDFDLEFKGIDGSGKQYNTQDIIDRKRKDIYNCFGAGFLLLGQDSVGSYALSASQTSTHGFYVQRNLLWKTDVINNQLIPALLKANNIRLNWQDMPVFEPASPDEVSLDEISKAVQRMKSVGAMTPKLLERFYTQLGADIEGIEDLNFDDGDTSRGGESNGTSGTGNSQSGGANSATNSENSVDRSVKQFVHDGDLIIDTNTDKPINLMDVNPETGEYNSVH